MEAHYGNRNFGILLGFIVFFSVAYLAASEFLSTSPSKGEVLVFRRAKSRFPVRPDEETGNSMSVNTLGGSVNHAPEDTPSEKPNRDLPQDAPFCWKDLCYNITVKGQPRRLLDNVDGWVQPGKITALMVRDYFEDH